MAARAGPGQDPGRRATGGSGRKTLGWAGQCAGRPPPRSGPQAGLPTGSAHEARVGGPVACFPHQEYGGAGGPVRRRRASASAQRSCDGKGPSSVFKRA